MLFQPASLAGGGGFAQVLYVAHWRLAEVAFVFPVEM
jgi:hypothetical protein